VGERGRACSTHDREESCTKLLIRKRPIGGPRHRWVDSIVMNLKEIKWEIVAEDRDHIRALVSMDMNILN
jgi:hypothetical protein